MIIHCKYFMFDGLKSHESLRKKKKEGWEKKRWDVRLLYHFLMNRRREEMEKEKEKENEKEEVFDSLQS